MPDYTINRLAGETFDVPTFGFEVEFEYAASVASQRDGIDMLAHHSRPGGWAQTLGFDCSLHNGREFRSVVGTLAWWREHWSAFATWCNRARAAGYRAYTTHRCGGHVHVSYGHLSAAAIQRVYDLVYTNPDFWKRVSRRRRRELDNWAAITGSPVGMDNWVLSVRGEAPRLSAPYPYIGAAVRFSSEHRTLEFRLYRGTLSADGWWRYLLFTDAAQTYAQLSHPTTADAFLGWLEATPQYAELAQWYHERWPVAVTASV